MTWEDHTTFLTIHKQYSVHLVHIQEQISFAVRKQEVCRVVTVALQQATSK
jgi:hypothetical protein